ncbi:hypothetical protein IQ259_14160 [Fortiea sp. LEGE XX443]|uniref:hypothetical protein n=1 Tax=Fortiea sp. LEGE XX443 TaxID=1828611 RepID=UPI00188073BE|nr:hypothetical protein [Fortiea sp. LEGE XX443]MBE9006166.1 hypothetical protein [Fortiea sp. LEGE XX443]
MKTATSTTTAIEQQSLSSHDSVIKQQSLNSHDSASNFSESSLDTLDDTEFELERIMFEEFAHGLPSDIPMADF